MSVESKGREIHGRAEILRERGETIEALKLYQEAFKAYQEDNDLLGFSEAQAAEVIALIHLWEKTNFEGWLVRAKHTAMSSVEMAEKSGIKEALSLPYSKLGKVQEALGELDEAVGSYKRSYDLLISNPPPEHGIRPAMQADFKLHWLIAAYMSGDKSVLEQIEESIKDLEAADEVKSNKDIWLSGAHMRVAEALKEEDLAKAKEHLQVAKDIIDSNPELTIRLTQWQKLAESFQ